MVCRTTDNKTKAVLDAFVKAPMERAESVVGEVFSIIGAVADRAAETDLGVLGTAGHNLGSR